MQLLKQLLEQTSHRKICLDVADLFDDMHLPISNSKTTSYKMSFDVHEFKFELNLDTGAFIQSGASGNTPVLAMMDLKMNIKDLAQPTIKTRFSISERDDPIILKKAQANGFDIQGIYRGDEIKQITLKGTLLEVMRFFSEYILSNTTRGDSVMRAVLSYME